MRKYQEWRSGAAERTEQAVLMTIETILEDRGKYLSSGELDDLKDCWWILKMIEETRYHDMGYVKQMPSMAHVGHAPANAPAAAAAK